MLFYEPYFLFSNECDQTFRDIDNDIGHNVKQKFDGGYIMVVNNFC